MLVYGALRFRFFFHLVPLCAKEGKLSAKIAAMNSPGSP
jgi:hypothetical protein